MTIKLKGWQRLWILVSILYLLPVLYYSILKFPKIESIEHDDSFYESLTKESRDKLSPEHHRFVFTEDMVEMPNKHVLEFRTGVSQHEKEKVSKEYYDATVKILNQRRLKHIVLAFAYWIVPCIMIYVIGWAVGWVYRGFKAT